MGRFWKLEVLRYSDDAEPHGVAIRTRWCRSARIRTDREQLDPVAVRRAVVRLERGMQLHQLRIGTLLCRNLDSSIAFPDTDHIDGAPAVRNDCFELNPRSFDGDGLTNTDLDRIGRLGERIDHRFGGGRLGSTGSNRKYGSNYS